MTTSKAAAVSQPSSATALTHECCMCGDYGFSYELFQCKICHFRSQHRYCSNLYPNVGETHRICNWCLTQKDDAKEKSQNSSNSSSSFRNDDDSTTKINTNHKKKNSPSDNNNNNSLIVRRQGSTTTMNQLQLKCGPIKKQRSVEVLLPAPAPAKKPPSPSPSPSVTTRKRILTNGTKEEKLRRTRSEDITNGRITRQVFRNKVRRYKLLDEVSS